MAVGTLLAFMITTYVAGKAMETIGGIKAGNAAKRIGEYNAQMSELQAADALSRGTTEEQRFRSGVRGLIGTQRTDYAGQGVDVAVGSAVDVQADSAFLGELDALTIRQNARREAWGYQVQAENYRRGGQLAANESRWRAAGTVLGGAYEVGSLLSQRYGFSRPTTAGGAGGDSGIGTTPPPSRQSPPPPVSAP